MAEREGRDSQSRGCMIESDTLQKFSTLRFIDTFLRVMIVVNFLIKVLVFCFSGKCSNNYTCIHAQYYIYECT